MIVYADTSALVKRLLAEDGADVAGEVWRTAGRTVASDLIYPEARAALGAARRAGRLDDAGLRRAVCRLERMHDDIELVQTDRRIVDLAGGLAERHALRGCDAVHLAAALSIDAPRVVVTTWDQRLAAASAENGLAVVPIGPAPTG
jgi:predicted nucleic acid-binding protein